MKPTTLLLSVCSAGLLCWGLLASSLYSSTEAKDPNQAPDAALDASEQEPQAMGQAMPHTIREQTLQPELPVRVKVYAQRSELVRCPLSYPLVKWVIPDGSLVKKGDVLVRFDLKDKVRQREDYAFDHEHAAADLQKNITNIDNQIAAIKDRLANVRDALKVNQSRLAYNKSLPIADEVRIVQGRLRVSKQNFEAAQEDIAKDKDRLDRKLISPLAYQKSLKDFNQKKSRYLFAQQELAYAKLPASSSTLRKLELTIANQVLEIERLENEIQKQKEIATLQKKRANRHMQRLQRRIKEVEEELKHGELFAPIDGVVSYNGRFKQSLAEGGKPSKESPLMEIPDMASLALKGAIPERQRGFFQRGDEITLAFNEDVDRVRVASIDTIKRLPRDIAEKEKGSWGDNKSTGIKVYDFIATLKVLDEDLRPGMLAQGLVRAKQKITGPTVPIRYLKVKHQTHYLAHEGVYKPVKGDRIDASFVLQDSTWVGRTIELYGRFSQERGGDPLAAVDAGGRLHAAGELVPVQQVDVNVPRMKQWFRIKLAWLIEEDQVVKKGDVVARLSSKDLDDKMERYETEVKSDQADIEAREKELALKKEQHAFEISREKNNLEIARIDQRIIHQGLDTMSIYQAKMNITDAKGQQAYAKARLDWARAHKDHVSSQELAKREREMLRSNLRLERQELLLKALMAGATALQRSQADTDLIKQEVDFELLEFKSQRDVVNEEESIFHRKRRNRRDERRLMESIADKAKFEVLAPADGLIKYAKMWDGIGMSKAKAGNDVWRGMRIMSVSQVSQMYIKVNVPERYFSQLSEGLGVEVVIPSLSKLRLKATISTIESMVTLKREVEQSKGIYASHEGLGEHVVNLRVTIDPNQGVSLKPGAVAYVLFPFSK